MNEETAEENLQATLKEYRRRSYQALTRLVGQNDVREAGAADGTRYVLEVTVLWDGEPRREFHRRGSVKRAAYPGSARWPI